MSSSRRKVAAAVAGRRFATAQGAAGPQRSPTRTAEHARLEADAKREKNWKRWGPYLAERQWARCARITRRTGNRGATSRTNTRSRTYRWGEDGLLGVTDRECRLCFALVLWNGKDPILKERLFGLTGPEGNHGEDVKECYFYLDSTPTHSWMRALYKYPQAEFPYERLRAENRRRGRSEPEFEVLDTGLFDGGRYFDVFAEFAKGGPNDLLIEALERSDHFSTAIASRSSFRPAASESRRSRKSRGSSPVGW